MMALLRAWYVDENALFRQKTQSRLLKQIAPLLSLVIHQGIQEGKLSSPYPDQVGEILLTILQGMSENLGFQLLEMDRQPVHFEDLVPVVDTYTHAAERVLGAAPGSLHFFDTDALKLWIDEPPGQS
jgi:hypothetical protein